MKNINDVCVLIQARLGSTRVPGKMLRPFAGTTLVDILFEKLKSSKVMFVNFDDHIAHDCLQTIISLREKGVSCEIYPTKSKLKKQLDYANQREIPFVVMIGPDEYLKKEFIIKNMDTGTQSVFKTKNLIGEVMNLI